MRVYTQVKKALYNTQGDQTHIDMNDFLVENKVFFPAVRWQLDTTSNHSWWRHQMETFSTHKGQWRGVFFDLRPNKRLSKQWWGWWFETLSSPLWRHCNAEKILLVSQQSWGQIHVANVFDVDPCTLKLWTTMYWWQDTNEIMHTNAWAKSGFL